MLGGAYGQPQQACRWLHRAGGVDRGFAQRVNSEVSMLYVSLDNTNKDIACFSVSIAQGSG